MKLLMLFTSVFALCMWVYSILINGYIPLPSDYLILAVFNLILADGYRKNKD